MKYTDNALNVLTAMSYDGIGKAWVLRNLRSNLGVEQIVALVSQKVSPKTAKPPTVGEFEQKKQQYKALIDKMSTCCDGLVALGDADFPQHRGRVKDSERPVLLYYKGNIQLLNLSNNKNVSVIGLLNPGAEIYERERELVAQLLKGGAIIVSGLALGCDSIAHAEALDANGKTIAILPSPLSNILPASNRGLAARIVAEGGLLITEYGSNFKHEWELKGRYVARNRLQALFCDTIVLLASYAKDSATLQNSIPRWHLAGQKLDSGARLAMEFAREYGICRAVMYDESIDRENPMFDLCREIIARDKQVTIISQNDYPEKLQAILSIISRDKQITSQTRLL